MKSRTMLTLDKLHSKEDEERRRILALAKVNEHMLSYEKGRISLYELKQKVALEMDTLARVPVREGEKRATPV